MRLLSMILRIASLLTLILWTIGFTSAQETEDSKNKALLQTLISGGSNIYFRHAATDWSQTDKVHKTGDWTSCDPNQIRQLSDEGRSTARRVGKAIRKLNIPIGNIYSSPYCRAVETAELMQLGSVKITTGIMNLRIEEYFGGHKAVVERLRQRLAKQPRVGTNAILVAHGNVAREATQVYPSEAEGIIFKPDGNGGFLFVGRLTPDDWLRLAH